MSLKKFSEWAKIMEDLISGQTVPSNPVPGVPPVNDKNNAAVNAALDQLYKLLGSETSLWNVAMDSINKAHSNAMISAQKAIRSSQARPGMASGGENGANVPFQGGAPQG